MVSISCKFCLCLIDVKAWASHIKDKKHEEKLPSKIIVKGDIPINKIHEHFSTFGKIKSTDVVKKDSDVKSIQYVYKDRTVYTTIAHRQHVILGQQMEITWDKKSHEVLNTDFRERINMRLKQTDSFARHMVVLRSKLQPDSADRETTLKEIYIDLINIITPIFPNTKIDFFGSTAIGLGMPTSSLDIYLSNSETELSLDSIHKALITSKTFKLVETSNDVISCRHKTKMTCRLSVQSHVKLAVKHSELVSYYLSLDEKIHQLMLMVKYWTNCCGFFKMKFLNSYSACLLVIFFLQQKPYNLPSVADLQRKAPNDLVNGWNCSFAFSEVSSSSLKKATILELTIDFFKFYASFDFVSYVVAPFVGFPVEKSRFLKPYDLPSCYSQYLEHKKDLDLDYGFCIQDPFEHHKNLSKQSSRIGGGNFAARCRTCLEHTSKEQKFLFKILNLSPQRHFTVEKVEGMNKTNWKKSIKNLVSDILVKVFSSKVNEEHKTTEIVYSCEGIYDVWEDRIKILKQLPSGMTEIAREINTTAQIIKRKKPKISHWFMCVHLKFKTTTSVEISIKGTPKRQKPSFFFDHYMCVKVKKFLEEEVSRGKEKNKRNLSKDVKNMDGLLKGLKILDNYDLESEELDVHLEEKKRKFNGSNDGENSEEVRRKKRRRNSNEGKEALKEITNKRVTSQTDGLICKLFAERRILFSDAKAICAKLSVDSSDQLLKKIRVISFCQEAIDAMSYRKVKLRVKPPPETKVQTHISPIHKSSTKFNFTSVLRDSRTKTFSDNLLELLQTIGIFNDNEDVDEIVDSVAEALSSGVAIDKTIAAQILQISLLESKDCGVQKRMADAGTQCVRGVGASIPR